MMVDPANINFAALFDGSDAQNTLTARTASWLYTSAGWFSDSAFDDIDRHGDAPVADDDNDWYFFDELPRITWREGAGWRRQMARAFDDLAGDLAEGRAPLPRCTAEEFALYLIIRRCSDLLADDDDYFVQSVADLSRSSADANWDHLSKVFLYDHNFLRLYEVQPDRVKDPNVALDDLAGTGEILRPRNWYRTFGDVAPRTIGRPYRR